MLNVNFPRGGIRHIQRGQIGNWDRTDKNKDGISPGKCVEVYMPEKEASSYNWGNIDIPLSGFVNPQKTIAMFYAIPFEARSQNGSITPLILNNNDNTSSEAGTQHAYFSTVRVVEITAENLRVQDGYSQKYLKYQYKYVCYYALFSYVVYEFY